MNGTSLGGARHLSDSWIETARLRHRLHVWDHGARTVVALHPTGFCGGVWRDLASRVQPGYRWIAPDTRGHGDSDKPEGPYALPEFGRDLLALLEALGLQGVDAVGHSGGGSAIAWAAAHAPERFRRLVLVDPIFRPDSYGREDPPPKAKALAHAVRRRRAHWPSRSAVLHSYAGKPPFKRWCRPILEDYINCGFRDRPDGSVELKCPPAIEARIYESHAPEWDPFATLAALEHQVLLIRGSESEDFSPLSYELTMKALRHGRGIVMRSSHFVPMERPAELAAAAREFLEAP